MLTITFAFSNQKDSTLNNISVTFRLRCEIANFISNYGPMPSTAPNSVYIENTKFFLDPETSHILSHNSFWILKLTFQKFWNRRQGVLPDRGWGMGGRGGV